MREEISGKKKEKNKQKRNRKAKKKENQEKKRFECESPYMVVYIVIGIKCYWQRKVVTKVMPLEVELYCPCFRDSL